MFPVQNFFGMEVWNGIWKKILVWNGTWNGRFFGMEWIWNGRFLVWNGNGMEENCQYGIWKNRLPFHTMPWSFIHKIFEQNFYLCLTVYLVRIWSCKNQRWSPRGRPWPRGRPRGHTLKSLALASKVKSLASKPHVLENCPVLGSRTALFFEQLKFRWKTAETSRKICEHVFCFPHLEHRRSQGGEGARLPQLKFHQKRLLFLHFQFLFSIFLLQ